MVQKEEKLSQRQPFAETRGFRVSQLLVTCHSHLTLLSSVSVAVCFLKICPLNPFTPLSSQTPRTSLLTPHLGVSPTAARAAVGVGGFQGRYRSVLPLPANPLPPHPASPAFQTPHAKLRLQVGIAYRLRGISASEKEEA
jgi:hypothetical protein